MDDVEKSTTHVTPKSKVWPYWLTAESTRRDVVQFVDIELAAPNILLVKLRRWIHSFRTDQRLAFLRSEVRGERLYRDTRQLDPHLIQNG